MSTLPPRLSKAAFERFEPILGEALSAPNGTWAVVEGLANTTVAARIRDVICSYRINRWSSSIPEPDRIKSLRVFHTDKGVFVGREDPRKATSDIAKLSPGFEPLKPPALAYTWTLDELRALGLLLSTGKLVGPIELPHDIAPHVATAFEALDVSCTPTPTGFVLF